MSMRQDCDFIVQEAIRHVLPDEAVKRALTGRRFSSGRLLLAAVGKAAWSMAQAAYRVLGTRIDEGIVITKYGHSGGAIGHLTICEAGHPLPDENSFRATERALAMTAHLTAEDTVLFLLSGGGSALFESPAVAPRELQHITAQLLGCGADIVEINTLRKRLSRVKGGRFARHCAPARIEAIVLSDIVGDPLDMIASGPACPDSSTCADAMRIVGKYGLALSEEARSCLQTETPKTLGNVNTVITGSVRELCRAAAAACAARGYAPTLLTDCLTCQAREAGRFLSAVAKTHHGGKKRAFIAGGETVVHVTGHGKGGRNQELALAAAEGIAGLADVAAFSVGSDGTDGPTDAAGGYVDGSTAAVLAAQNVSIDAVLRNNDAYHVLALTDGLLITGATGTNVNDVSVVLIG